MSGARCAGCGRIIRAGEGRYTAMEPEQHWHATCKEVARESDGGMVSNKYRHWYVQMMARARLRTTEGHKEQHHILPHSLGGRRNAGNLVYLTFKEHFLAHWLLTKFTTGDDRRRMEYALCRMSQWKPGRTIASWQYRRGRAFLFSPGHLDHLKTQNNRRRAEGLSPENIEGIRKGMIGNQNGLGYKLSPEQKETLRLRMIGNQYVKGRKQTKEHRNNISAGLLRAYREGKR